MGAIIVTLHDFVKGFLWKMRISYFSLSLYATV